MSLPPGYEELRQLSRQEAGAVRTALARDPDGREVVVKCFRRQALQDWKQQELFEREIGLLRSLKHPRIPVLLRQLETEDQQLLVLSWIEGQALDQKLAAGWHPTLAEVADIAAQVLKLLDHLHRLPAPVLHRDLKPANLILDLVGQVHLIDFGAVTRLAVPGASTVVGTFGYMPPEQFAGRAVPASDIYALGMSLIHLLSGRAPAEMAGDSLQPEWERHLQLPPAWQAWFEDMVHPDESLRFGSAAKALAALPQPQVFQRTAGPEPPAKLLEILSQDYSGMTCRIHWDRERGMLWLRHRNSSPEAVALRISAMIGLLVVVLPLSFGLLLASPIIGGILLIAVVVSFALLLLSTAWKWVQLLSRREICLDRQFLEIRRESLGQRLSSVSLPRDQIRKLEIKHSLGYYRLQVTSAQGRPLTLLCSSNTKEAGYLYALFLALLLPEQAPETAEPVASGQA